MSSSAVMLQGTKKVFATSALAEQADSQTLARKTCTQVWCLAYISFMPGKGGVGAVMALAFAAFWLAEVFADAVEETAVDEATEGTFLLDTAVDTETMVLPATTAADVFAAAEECLDPLADEVVEFAGAGAGAAEAGFEGGLAVEGAFAEEGALEETFEGALEGAFEGAFEGGLAAEDGAFAAGAGLLGVLVTVFEEIPLTFIFVSTITISLPLAAVSEPATLMSLSASAAGAGVDAELAHTATQGVINTGMGSKTGIGGGGAGATG